MSAALALATLSQVGLAQGPMICPIGQMVHDDHGGTGVISGARADLCLVQYKDGQTQAWIPAKRLSTAPVTSNDNATAAAGGGVVTLRPNIGNRLIYRADALGHVVLLVKINGAAVRFLVDTGATLVSLTPEDAAAAGLKRSDLTFDQSVNTGNGTVRAAFATLREIRIDNLEVDNVKVAVIESLKQSVLGMSFLSRLKSFEMQNGTLTLNW